MIEQFIDNCFETWKDKTLQRLGSTIDENQVTLQMITLSVNPKREFSGDTRPYTELTGVAQYKILSHIVKECHLAFGFNQSEAHFEYNRSGDLHCHVLVEPRLNLTLEDTHKIQFWIHQRIGRPRCKRNIACDIKAIKDLTGAITYVNKDNVFDPLYISLPVARKRDEVKDTGARAPLRDDSPIPLDGKKTHI